MNTRTAVRRRRAQTAGAVLLSTLTVLALPGSASACACCAATGQRNVQTVTPSAHDADQIALVAFDGKAELLTGEAEPEDIRGLSATSAEYDLEASQAAGAWTFTFKTAGKVAGTLTFTPGKLSKFEVDTRQTAPENGMVTLYKEWKQTAAVTGTGMFKLSPGSSASLILQGRGNSCGSAEDFTHWSLVTQDKDVSFLFFGSLAKPRQAGP